jgi:hypothetical protein
MEALVFRLIGPENLLCKWEAKWVLRIIDLMRGQVLVPSYLVSLRN